MNNRFCPICPPCNEDNFNCIVFTQIGDTVQIIANRLNSMGGIPITEFQLRASNPILSQYPNGSQVGPGIQLTVPNCVETRPNNCNELLGAIIRYIELSNTNGLYNTATLGYAIMQNATLKIPALILTKDRVTLAPLDLFGGISPLDSTIFTPLSYNSQYTYELYSLEAVEDYLTSSTRINYTCSEALSYQGRASRLTNGAPQGCTSIYDSLMSVLETNVRPAVGVRMINRVSTIVIRVTVPTGINGQGLLTTQGVSLSDRVSTNGLIGSRTYYLSFSAVSTFLTNIGRTPCETIGLPIIPNPPFPTPIPTDPEDIIAACRRVAEEVRSRLGTVPRATVVDIGLIRGRVGTDSRYSPEQYIAGAIVIILPTPTDTPGLFFSAKANLAAVYLSPLSVRRTGNDGALYDLIYPMLEDYDMSRTFVYDLTSVIAWLAADTTFNSSCAIDVTQRWNAQCSNVINFLNTEIGVDSISGTIGTSIIADATGFNLRRVVLPDATIPDILTGGTLGATVTERKVVRNDVLVTINKAVKVSIAAVDDYLEDVQYITPCTYAPNQVNMPLGASVVLDQFNNSGNSGQFNINSNLGQFNNNVNDLGQFNNSGSNLGQFNNSGSNLGQLNNNGTGAGTIRIETNTGQIQTCTLNSSGLYTCYTSGM